jgi:hypothetical protein
MLGQCREATGTAILMVGGHTVIEKMAMEMKGKTQSKYPNTEIH